MAKRGAGSVFKRGRYYSIRYYDARGRRRTESSKSARLEDANRLLRRRLQAKDDGLPVDPQVGRLRFKEAAEDLLNDYRTNGRKSLDEAARRIRKHLEPFFGRRRMSTITTSDIRSYVAERQRTPIVTGKGDNERRRQVSNGEINRELTTLKRMFNLALQAGLLLHKPHIPMLRENNVRQGFFEREQFESVVDHLPAPIRPVVTFAYLTGWRVASEILPLQWRQVDFEAGEVRLDPGTTKNGKGREFPMTEELRQLLQNQLLAYQELARREGRLCPFVFHRNGKPIRSMTKAWRTACRQAGCPGMIPHDLRRTAVRNFVRAAIPEQVAMKLTGHQTRSVFDRYDITSKGDLKMAAARLDEASGRAWGSGNRRSAPSRTSGSIDSP